MTTLHIEHGITDLDVWKGAFARAAGIRAEHGVRRAEVRQPIDDPNYITIDLSFDDVAAAEGFLTQLQAIWQNPNASPALDGRPETRILETVIG